MATIAIVEIFKITIPEPGRCYVQALLVSGVPLLQHPLTGLLAAKLDELVHQSDEADHQGRNAENQNRNCINFQ
ncbi:hypothetical protein [Novosphingobium huizhouense]|uniref:hypothetical protein n=1 Tax=Novosphingobium huizhouense TaxID=2866625 RepID=UPI001CD8E169|nr:hypothetical protein [Novosphingobium huizhouense]